MSKPTITAYAWASDTNFAASPNPWDGQPTKVKAPAGVRAEGFEPHSQPPAEYFNHVLSMNSGYSVWQDQMWDADEEHGYTDGAQARVTIVEPTLAYDMSATTATGPGWGGVFHSSAGYALQAKKDSAILVLPTARILPLGATVTRVDCMVGLGATRAGADRVQLSRFFRTTNWSAPSVAYTGLTGTVDDGGGSGTVVLSMTGLSLGINPETSIQYSFVVKAGNNASTNPDNVYAFRFHWTDSGLTNR